MSWINKLLGDTNNKELTKHQRFVEEINNYEAELVEQTDEQLKAASLKLKQEITTEVEQVIRDTELINDRQERNKQRRFAINTELERRLSYAFAIAREASKRTLGLRHYDVQLVGALVLN